MGKNKNCWEFKQCGREVGGTRAQELGACPAALDNRLNGIHGGKNAGRACWVIAGTFCDGRPQGTFVSKYSSCIECDFYGTVLEEEDTEFCLPATLLAKLN